MFDLPQLLFLALQFPKQKSQLLSAQLLTKMYIFKKCNK